MIYFIKATQSGAIKIGVSNDPRKRLATMQTGSAEPLELLGVIPGQFDEERRLHERFQSYRMHGEWFRGDREFMSSVERLLQPSIEELIANSGATLWHVCGKAIIEPEPGFGNVVTRVALLCVCHAGCYFWHPPNYDDILGVVWPGERYHSVDTIVNATKRPQFWPKETESLRSPLLDQYSYIWVADNVSRRGFRPANPSLFANSP